MTARPVSTPSFWPNGDVPAAFAAAKERLEPIFVPTTWYVDDRGGSMMNMMQGVLGPNGQINFAVQNPGTTKAWHRHHKQTDFWVCHHGHLKAGIHRETDGKSWMIVIGERRPGILIIPPPLWHGASTVGHVPCGLMYYVTERYDPSKPDEDRRAHDSIEGFSWEVQHR